MVRFQPSRDVIAVCGVFRDVYVPNLKFCTTDLVFNWNGLPLVHKVPPKSFESMVRFQPLRDVIAVCGVFRDVFVPNLKFFTTELSFDWNALPSLHKVPQKNFEVCGEVSTNKGRNCHMCGFLGTSRDVYVPNLKYCTTELNFDWNALPLFHTVPQKSFEVYGEVSTIKGRNYHMCGF